MAACSLYSRGIDSEVVRATLKVLPKSITAFKSLPKVSYPELEKWTVRYSDVGLILLP